MKNQYFGDENDYKKYGVLRELNRIFPDGIAVCWMLTPDDGSTKGQTLKYLEKPETWRDADPQLFDSLRNLITGSRGRNVSLAKGMLDIRSALFFDRLLTDDPGERQSYFSELKRKAKGYELMFFDPDVGFAPPSQHKGRSKSSRYLFWDELKEFYTVLRQSILVYQHFTRERHDLFIANRIARILVETRAPEAYTLETSQVVFLLIPQSRHREVIEQSCRAISRRWNPHIKVWAHAEPRRIT